MSSGAFADALALNHHGLIRPELLTRTIEQGDTDQHDSAGAVGSGLGSGGAARGDEQQHQAQAHDGPSETCLPFVGMESGSTVPHDTETAMRPHRSWLTLGALLAIACDTADTPTQLMAPDLPAAVPELSTVKVPFDTTVTVLEPVCAGEVLELHLRQQLVTHGVIDANGGSHFHLVINDKGTTAVGLSSGTRYHETGATTETDEAIGVPPLIVTVHNSLNLISEGAAPNLQVNQLFHITINPAGDATGFTNVNSIICH
jgi:hypothetical protein